MQDPTWACEPASAYNSIPGVVESCARQSNWYMHTPNVPAEPYHSQLIPPSISLQVLKWVAVCDINMIKLTTQQRIHLNILQAHLIRNSSSQNLT